MACSPALLPPRTAAIARHDRTISYRNRAAQWHRRQLAVRAAGSDDPPPSPPSAADAVLERIKRAQQYKTSKSLPPTPAPVAPSDQAAAESTQQRTSVEDRMGAWAQHLADKDAVTLSEELQAVQQQQQQQSQAQQQSKAPPPGSTSTTAGERSGGSGGTFSRAPRQAADPAGLTAEAERSFRTQMGDANDAASWLKTVSSQGTAEQLDQGLRPEDFLLRKEALQRQQEVDIITVDAAYAEQLKREKQQQQQQQEQQQQGATEVYQPKVATWGVFPRAKDISKEYGGGRNLKPGAPLETEEAAAARKQRVSAALLEYRRAAGLDVDPQAEAQAQQLMDAGMALFNDGLITQAVPKFQEASALMPLRTRLGGQSRLQLAICLDSLGRSQEAYELYKQLEGHTAGPGVAKQAKRMLFGFRAAKDLKTERLSYAPTTSQWKRYFDRVLENSGTLYLSSEGESAEDDGSAKLATAFASAVMLLPFAFVAFKVITRG